MASSPSILSQLGSAASSGLLSQILGVGGQAAGLINALQQQGFINGGKINVLNYLNGLGQQANNNIPGIQGGLLPYLQGTMTNAGSNYFNGSQGAQGWLNQGLQGTGAFTQMADPNNVPGLSQVMQALQGAQGQAANGAGTAQTMANGQTAGQQPLLGAGTNLLSGNTANDQFQKLLQGYASNTLNNGGYTPQLNGVTQQGQSLLAPNAGVQQTGALASQLMSQIGNPVLPMSQVISMATNQSATGAQQQEQALKRQLMDRTGTTGPAVASGSENELLNNLGNQALQNQSAAVQNAIMGQQQAGLQGLGQANGLFNSATGANLGYQGQGLNAILQAAQQAQGNQGVMGQLGLGGGNLGLQTASTGGQLLNGLNQSSLGGLGALGALAGVQGQLGQDQSSNLFGAQNLNQTQNLNANNTLANFLGLQNSANSTSLQAMLGSAGPQSTALTNYLQLLGLSGSSQPSLFSQNYVPNENTFNLGIPAGVPVAGTAGKTGTTGPAGNPGGNGTTPNTLPGSTTQQPSAPAGQLPGSNNGGTPANSSSMSISDSNFIQDWLNSLGLGNQASQLPGFNGQIDTSGLQNSYVGGGGGWSMPGNSFNGPLNDTNWSDFWNMFPTSPNDPRTDVSSNISYDMYNNPYDMGYGTGGSSGIDPLGEPTSDGF